MTKDENNSCLMITCKKWINLRKLFYFKSGVSLAIHFKQAKCSCLNFSDEVESLVLTSEAPEDGAPLGYRLKNHCDR